LNTPTPEGLPPPLPPSPSSHPPDDTNEGDEVFSKQKGLMDYVNWKDIQRKIGITKATAYLFILKELLDNAVDYIETNHSTLDNGIPFVSVKIIKPRGSNYLRFLVINANDGTPAFSERRIRSVFDPNSKVSSKRNQFKINKGALGDALKDCHTQVNWIRTN
jgi:hypothetical protein